MRKRTLLAPLLGVLLLLTACHAAPESIDPPKPTGSPIVSLEPMGTIETEAPAPTITLDGIPEYTGNPYSPVNDNAPYFTESEHTLEPFETYAELDELGRCGVCYANICKELMPTEERGEIGMVKPSGWETARYDFVDGRYLYNRCHLIGYQLAGENANVKNLITGTRYMNVQGMLPFENQVADYVHETGNHVLYRVTPLFQGDELVARGVLMEALSVEDEGAGISFNVFCYNVQPGVGINYATGENWEDPESYRTENEKSGENEGNVAAGEITYILNTRSKRFHLLDCSSVGQIADHNKAETSKNRDELIAEGYKPCGSCRP